MTCCKCKCNSNRADCGINLLTHSNVSEVDADQVKCSACLDQTIATSTCTVCNEMLCDACVSAHKRVKLTRDHPITAIKPTSTVANGVTSQKVTVNRLYSCSKHASEKLQCYCEVCVKVTCVKCHESNGDHYAHRKVDVSQASATFRNELLDQLRNLNDKVGYRYLIRDFTPGYFKSLV